MFCGGKDFYNDFHLRLLFNMAKYNEQIHQEVDVAVISFHSPSLSLSEACFCTTALL